ncbi:transcription elongation factor GreA [Bifidobacterium sp. 82T24]|uniref:GreA/GreB family elongation factor n=1 Tax=Bifidobacterium pluvialisilvae TaxID=2834436 RepID=UPI001C59D039|nr:transcription elongation factor GreA [Bifidobacterium pluvialisilvae]MBW3087882.1 transcription elongation factor GreA [Bifidobacterium pluvialisilvae]
MAEEKPLLLTQEAYNQLKSELERRQGPIREEIIAKVAAARAEGDLSENGGYQAAREAQRKNQGRIDELTVKLRRAKILQAPPAGEVGNGSLVTLDVMGNEMQYVLGPRDLSVATHYEIISPESPIGAAILGTKQGDTVSYKAPNGRDIQVTVKESKPLPSEA